VSTNGTTALKLLKRNEYGSAGGLAGGWAGLSAYRTPSLSSLQNGGLSTGKSFCGTIKNSNERILSIAGNKGERERDALLLRAF